MCVGVHRTEKCRIPISLQAVYITHYINSDIYQTLLFAKDTEKPKKSNSHSVPAPGFSAGGIGSDYSYQVSQVLLTLQRGNTKPQLLEREAGREYLILRINPSLDKQHYRHYPER